MKNASRGSSTIVVIMSMVVFLGAGCATVPTANQTVAVPAPAGSMDVLDVAVDAAKAVGLPAVTKLDKANGVVEFGAFDAAPSGYAAQVRQRPDGQLDVTVKRGSSAGEGTVEEKAKEFASALDARLRQAAAPRPTPPPASTPRPASSQPRPGTAPATPSTPASPSAPARPDPAPAPPPAPTPAPSPAPAPSTVPKSEPVMLVISVPYANLRERGEGSARVIRVLPKGTRLTVLGKGNHWYLVRLEDGTQGWVGESVVSTVR